jgi:hypothetical protein
MDKEKEMTTATTARPAPRPAQLPPPERPTQTAANRQPPTAKKKVAFGTIEPQGHRILVYGGGGTGKTTLACNAPGPVAMFDLELSMPVLRPQVPPDADIRVVSGVTTWQDLRDSICAEGWQDVKTLVIDSVTKAEELALAHVLATIPLDSKQKAERIEDYPYGKGYSYLYDEFLKVLGDLDQHVRAGRNVVLIAHDCTTTVPNPTGADWLRYEPRLQSPPSGKNSIRLRVREWADHVLFLGFDLGEVHKKKMADGFNGRTLYPVELPHCMAKSRTCCETQIVKKNDPSIWTNIIK